MSICMVLVAGYVGIAGKDDRGIFAVSSAKSVCETSLCFRISQTISCPGGGGRGGGGVDNIFER